MGDCEHGGGDADDEDAFPASVTGVGGPVLLAATVPELGRGDVLAGRYQIEAVIGTGGSGRVMRAFDRVTRELVALKVLRPEFLADPVWTERFSRELRVGRQIQHPNVCRVFDIGESDGHRFLSMELATGGTVRALLVPEGTPRDLDERIADARAVIDGVAALHAAGIVHRDLKPENILRMGDGRLVVTDFGLATDPGAGPATTIMIGTPRYMAPEVVMGDPATTGADVWALGVVMHEILFGRRPDRSVVNRGCRQFKLPKVTSLKERRIAELCGRCSEDDVARRPTSALEVVREFRTALLGQRFTRTTLRRQSAWGAVALAALATLGLVRNRWSSSAVASSSATASAISKKAPQPTGVAEDWSQGASRLAAFDGRVHCVWLSPDLEVATVVWGEPRRAENVVVATGVRSRANLLSETFSYGCPALASDGRSLLFERVVDGSGKIFLSESVDGRDAKQLVQGGRPVWLPNGQEFSFILDSRHAALFSIPTRQMTVVTDDLRGQLAIEENSVDPDGKSLAILYTTESMSSIVVVHKLPGLEILHRMQLPPWARGLRFGQHGQILFTAVGPGGLRQLLAANLVTGIVRKIGAVPGSDVRSLLGAKGTGHPLLVRRLTYDLGVQGQSTALTRDGQSVSGSISATGKLLIHRRLPDAREVIVLRSEDGTEEQVTDGPSDMTPAFFSDGANWVHSRTNSGELIECSVDSRKCSVIHTDALVPTFPTPDQSGRQIAYVTAMGAPRIRIVSRETGEQRDLGPALLCPPVWTGSQRLWVQVTLEGSSSTWAEVHTDSGKRSGLLRHAHTSVRDECAPPDDVLQAAPRIVARAEETSALLRVRLASAP